MPIDRATQTEQIANELRAEIEAGTYQPGEKLPSDAELARRFDVSKPTIGKARAMLAALGIIESRAGAATTVRDISREPMPVGNRIQQARRTGRIYPEGHYARIIDAELARPSADVAKALGVNARAKVIRRERVTYAPGDTPLATSVTYAARELAASCPALLEGDRIKQGTTLYLEQQTGRRAGAIASAVWCEPAPSAVTDRLNLPAGAYVLTVATTTHDTDGKVLAHEIEHHPPGARLALDLDGT